MLSTIYKKGLPVNTGRTEQEKNRIRNLLRLRTVACRKSPGLFLPARMLWRENRSRRHGIHAHPRGEFQRGGGGKGLQRLFGNLVGQRARRRVGDSQ